MRLRRHNPQQSTKEAEPNKFHSNKQSLFSFYLFLLLLMSLLRLREK
eukprot:UN14462